MAPSLTPPEAQPFYLDGPLYYLGLALPGAIDVTLAGGAGERAALLFKSAQRAQAHLGALPQGVQVQEIARDDWRAKEELLLAALARGADTLWIDAAAGSLEPALRAPTARALDYVRSFKRQSACL